MLCLFSKVNVFFPALYLEYATRLLTNHAAGWANHLQLQICFLLTCSIHEFIPIMITERPLSTGLGKLNYTQKSIACSQFFSLFIKQDAPTTIILVVISMILTLLRRMGRVLHSHLPLSSGSRQLQMSHLLFHLLFEHSTWLSGLREQLLKNNPFHGIECTSPFYLTHLQKDD